MWSAGNGKGLPAQLQSLHSYLTHMACSSLVCWIADRHSQAKRRGVGGAGGQPCTGEELLPDDIRLHRRGTPGLQLESTMQPQKCRLGPTDSRCELQLEVRLKQAVTSSRKGEQASRAGMKRRQLSDADKVLHTQQCKCRSIMTLTMLLERMNSC